MSVDHRRAGLRALRDRPSPRARARCQSITGALACAPGNCPRLCASDTVSVDHRRAGLRARQDLDVILEGVKCQSITGALACAPRRGMVARASSDRVSRSPARWPARPSGVGVRRRLISVSVDHRRAGLRALLRRETADIYSVCQSNTGALACAPDPGRRGSAHTGVSVDHRRAGLRAARASGRHQRGAVVSVDHRRAGLRAHEYKTQKFMRLWCQSITGALACAPGFVEGSTSSRHPCQSITGALACALAKSVSRSPARWPARPNPVREAVMPEGVSRSPARWPARQ